MKVSSKFDRLRDDQSMSKWSITSSMPMTSFSAGWEFVGTQKHGRMQSVRTDAPRRKANAPLTWIASVREAVEVSVSACGDEIFLGTAFRTVRGVP
jgi:hypothetical protein